MAAILRSGRIFKPEVVPEVDSYIEWAMPLPTFWVFDRRSSSQIDGVMAMTYFLTPWPSSMTYLFVNVTFWNCSPITYVDQILWWYVKAFMSYAWQNGQTNKQMKGQSEIAYLPKFAYIMLIVMVIVITEILYTILIFDCFENQ